MSETRKHRSRFLLVGALVVLAAIGVGWIWLNNKSTTNVKSGEESEEGVKQKPRVEIDKLHFKRYDKQATKAEIQLAINNPAPIGIRIDSVRYTVFMANERIAESRYTKPTHIKASATSNVVLKLSIDNEKNKKAFAKGTSDGNDSTEYRIVADIYTNIPFFNGKAIPYETTKKLPAFIFPTSEMKRVRVDKLGLNKTQIVLETILVNPNSIPVGFTKANYVFAFDGDTLEPGSIDSTVYAPPHGSTPLNIPLKIKTGKAIETAIAKLLKTDKTEYYYRFETELLSKNPAMKGCVAISERSGKMSDLEK